MLNLQVDEGYAFDYLAILYIKNKKMPSKDNHASWKSCFLFLKKQIKNDFFWKKIIRSKEFKELKKANIETFECVEKARYGKISAKTVDEANMKRFHAKSKLQKKFFPKSAMKEIKS